MTQKTTNPSAARTQPLGCPRALPKRNGRGRTRFLTHCAGRRDTNRAVRTLAEEYPAAAEARSPEDVAAMCPRIVTGAPAFSNSMVPVSHSKRVFRFFMGVLLRCPRGLPVP